MYLGIYSTSALLENQLRIRPISVRMPSLFFMVQSKLHMETSCSSAIDCQNLDEDSSESTQKSNNPYTAFERLNLSTNPYLEKQLKFLCG
jgi:hypothetical protein